MNKENTDKLLNTFPALYDNNHFKQDGLFRFADGWFNLVWDVSVKLLEHRVSSVTINGRNKILRS